MTLWTRLLAVAAAIGLLASACGGNNDDGGRSGTGDQGTATAEATGAATPTAGAAGLLDNSIPEPGVISSPTIDPAPEPVDDGQPAPVGQPEELSLVLTLP